MSTHTDPQRASSLSPPEMFMLDQWGHTLRRAFGWKPYLVGSVERGERNYRDVDVRMLVPDDEYAVLLGDHPQRVTVLNIAISVWGQKVTGLPIDFQFQQMTRANEKHGDLGKTPRNPIGARSGVEFLDYDFPKADA